MQLVDLAHDREFARRHGLRLVINGAAAEFQKFGLLAKRQIMRAVDHRFALSRPALLSAPDKKSFSSANSPILACSSFKSTAGAGSAPKTAPPNKPAAPSVSRAFQSVIWFGCTSYCCASSASVFSPLRAATATFALKAGLCVRRARLAMLAPDARHYRRFQADFPLIELSELGQPPLYKVQTVGSQACQEYWIPAEDLPAFNRA